MLGRIFNPQFHGEISRFNPRPTITPTPGASTDQIERLIQALKDNALAIQNPGGQTPEEYNESTTAFTIDVTTAHNNLEVRVPSPCYYIQVWCDGSLEGCTLRTGAMSNEALALNRFDVIPVFNPEKVYFTNDARLGRTSVVLYFTRTNLPLGQVIGGESITRAELAVRNGGFSVYDRRGEVVWQDAFEEGLGHWDTDVSGTGAWVGLTHAIVHRGNLSVKMIAGSDANHYAGLTRPIVMPKLTGALGVETAWSVYSNIESAEFYVDICTGLGLAAHWGVKAIIATGQTSVLTAAGTWTDTGSPNPMATLKPLIFQPMKFVFNPSTLYYTRFLGASAVIPLTGQKGYTSVDASAASMTITGRLVGTLATNGVGYCDGFILTQNE